LTDLWDKDGRWRAVAIGYAALVALSFAFFFPIYAAVPLTPARLDLRMWLHSWR
jgi:dolichyl-phosphate-mannose--protein O-mannosyl transferase